MARLLVGGVLGCFSMAAITIKFRDDDKSRLQKEVGRWKILIQENVNYRQPEASDKPSSTIYRKRSITEHEERVE